MKKVFLFILCLALLVVLLVALYVIGLMHFIENGYKRDDKQFVIFGDIVIQHHQESVPYYAEEGEVPLGLWQGYTPKIYAYQGPSKVRSYYFQGSDKFHVRVSVEKAWQYGRFLYPIQKIAYWAKVSAAIVLLLFLLSLVNQPFKRQRTTQSKQALNPKHISQPRASALKLEEKDIKAMATKRRASTFIRVLEGVYAGSPKTPPVNKVIQEPQFDEIGRLAEAQNRIQREKTARLAAEREKDQALKLAEQKSQEAKEAKQIKAHYQSIATRKTQELDTYKVRRAEEIEEIKKELKAFVEQQAHTRYSVRIKQMKAELGALNTKYCLAIERAKVLDINLEDQHIENILKGRRFEIYIASLFDKQGFEILEWTPDKGTENNLYVHQNNNPDLLLRSRHSGFKLAVECKFCSQPFYRHPCGEPVISWTSVRKYQYYQRYANKHKDCPVYVVVGYKGDASNPESCFWAELQVLKHTSVDLKKNVTKKDDQYALKESLIGAFKFNEKSIIEITQGSLISD